MIDQVFELFAQAERSPDRSQGGLGIGLALVRTVAQLHGGTVRARGDGPGTGSCFTVRLPAIESPPEALPDLALAQAIPPPGGKVLVVDDNRDAADTIATVLQMMGFDTAAEYDPYAALSRSANESFDAYLLDIGLPVMDGHELARQLRRRPGSASALPIAVTGYGSALDRQKTQDAGFDHHLVKPVEPGDIAELLARPRVVAAVAG